MRKTDVIKFHGSPIVVTHEAPYEPAYEYQPHRGDL